MVTLLLGVMFLTGAWKMTLGVNDPSSMRLFKGVVVFQIVVIVDCVHPVRRGRHAVFSSRRAHWILYWLHHRQHRHGAAKPGVFERRRPTVQEVLPYTPTRTANNDLERGLTEYSGVGGDE